MNEVTDPQALADAAYARVLAKVRDALAALPEPCSLEHEATDGFTMHGVQAMLEAAEALLQDA